MTQKKMKLLKNAVLTKQSQLARKKKMRNRPKHVCCHTGSFLMSSGFYSLSVKDRKRDTESRKKARRGHSPGWQRRKTKPLGLLPLPVLIVFLEIHSVVKCPILIKI